MPFLLDTNVWIHYLKQPSSPIHAAGGWGQVVANQASIRDDFADNCPQQ